MAVIILAVCFVIVCIALPYLIFSNYYGNQITDLREKLNTQKDECRKNHVARFLS